MMFRKFSKGKIWKVSEKLFLTRYCSKTRKTLPSGVQSMSIQKASGKSANWQS
jgi:hypothetical protein